LVKLYAILALGCLFSGCAEDDKPGETGPAPVPTEADPLAKLARASLDIRGVRPSDSDIERIEADPSAYAALVDAYMKDDRFADQVVALYSEIYLTTSESFRVPVTDNAGLAFKDQPEYHRSIGEEPLRILARIADEDLPYTELVTADWTMSDSMLRSIWPVESTAGSAGWQPSTYTDGRPMSGVLSTNGMWWRYGSTSSNLNRKRANQLSRILLCDDYLSRPIEFDRDINLLDSEAIEDAINTDPGCVSCHVSLDPIGSYLFGFWYTDDQSAADSAVYHPERELRWQTTSGVAPGYFGQTGGNLEQLGHHIAGDPRFVQCAVEQAFSQLMGRQPALHDSDALTLHRERFLNGDLTLRALFRSIITHPRYEPLSHVDQLTVTGQATRKMVTAEQLATQVEALTGFHWTSDGYDMMRTDARGVGNLAGRADGHRMSKHNSSPNTTLLLVQERLAQAGATHLVAQELELAKKNRTLFTEVDLTAPLQADTSAAQLQALHLKVLSRRVSVDGPEVEANLALWNELHAAEGSPSLAWTGVLTALLRDPDFILY
jgi:hypothetical protein